MNIVRLSSVFRGQMQLRRGHGAKAATVQSQHSAVGDSAKTAGPAIASTRRTAAVRSAEEISQVTGRRGDDAGKTSKTTRTSANAQGNTRIRATQRTRKQ